MVAVEDRLVTRTRCEREVPAVRARGLRFEWAPSVGAVLGGYAHAVEVVQVRVAGRVSDPVP